ncbi:MAG: sulfurtransferase TusA family protein [Rhodospirillales bacterium]|nr:sulfurtransferase TusA family protein [Rhodospirillales bacterium]MCW8861679.1 sulfurtransferase TusA family protein [Rhodospirillales bacterium]MCW8951520.1 sulfurtransferase TusA family protein [Rhodospirillales bacterium]MCW8971595.1 sulfurtransferase TusA family protein [Rhodospirillales bacterium]MCW9003048.1 sulfurtransferase TusA family protein [Rhodospirillales bacterium]
MGLFGSSKDKKKAEKPAGEITLGGTTYTISRTVDCIGDSCPRPQLMTKKALNEAAPGDVIEVLVDNPSSTEAIPPMMNDLGASHLETIKAERCWEIYVQKD